MKKVATFSNGSTKTYGGKRDVTAAWAIIERDTEKTKKMGFSLDRYKAKKTANSSCILRVTGPLNPADLLLGKDIRKEGFKSIYEYNKHQKKLNAEHAENYRIEIINV